MGDVAKYRLEDLETESKVLRDAYIARSGEADAIGRRIQHIPKKPASVLSSRKVDF